VLTLDELQKQFLDALTNSPGDELLSVIEPRTPGVQARLDIYRNNWRCNLRHALTVSFPVVERLVGAEFFGWMADCFIDVQPSRSGNLDDYGAEFPAFVRDFPAAQSLPYLGDVAQLEWLIDTVMSAPDTTADDGSVLPVGHLFASNFPAHRIWQVNQPEWSGDDAVSLDVGPAYLLVQRVARKQSDGWRFDLELQSLDREAFVALQDAAARLTFDGGI
jgi:hypothetical protein